MAEYVLSAGALYEKATGKMCMRIKGVLSHEERRILSPDGGTVLTAVARNDGDPGGEGDVSGRTYALLDSAGAECAQARPRYAAGQDPARTGWPVNRMPRVDRARVTLGGVRYSLVMVNSQTYALLDSGGRAVLRIVHRGLTGGWGVEDQSGLRPEIVCGVFVFCRYIERENEFVAV